LTAAVFGEPVSEVTPAQFAKAKAFVTVTLAIGFATLSMVVSVIAHSPLRSEAPSKLSRALRAFIAARRKTLRRIEPTIEYRYRYRLIHVPVDTLGRVLSPDRAA
jgi:hypothetical protein